MKITSPGPQPGGRSPAPGEVGILQSFINTFDREGRQEGLPTIAALKDWLDAVHLLEPDAALGGSALRHATSIREGLRTLALANNGYDLDSMWLEAMDESIRELEITMRLTAAGELRLTAPAAFGRAMATILDIVRTSMDDGSWLRLKACQREVCQWAFWDGSRNRSSRWCAMDICGNRVKGLSAYHRRKQRLASGSKDV